MEAQPTQTRKPVSDSPAASGRNGDPATPKQRSSFSSISGRRTSPLGSQMQPSSENPRNSQAIETSFTRRTFTRSKSRSDLNRNSQAKFMNDRDVDWLESMLPGLQSNSATEYSEESYLTELVKPEDLRWLLLPSSSIRTMWDMLTLGLVLYTALTVPYVIAFLGPNTAPPQWMVSLACPLGSNRRPHHQPSCCHSFCPLPPLSLPPLLLPPVLYRCLPSSNA